MKNEKLVRMFAVASFALLGVCFASCGGDDDGNDDNGQKPVSESKQPEEAKPFVGLWHLTTTNTAYRTFPEMYAFFSKDGKARVIEYTYDRGSSADAPAYWKLHPVPQWNWNYDDTTKILATDYSRATWQTTIATDNSWSGFAIWSDSKPIYTAEKVTTPQMIVISALGGTWVSADRDTLTFMGANESGTTGTNGGVRHVDNIAMTIKGKATYKGERYDFEVRMINPDPTREGQYKGELNLESDKIELKSGNYYSQKNYNGETSEFRCWQNITIVNPYDYTNTYFDLDMNVVDKNYGPGFSGINRQGRYYRLK